LASASARYYTERIREHGPTPLGVDWNSAASQELRFTQLLRLLDEDKTYDVIDYGCGYGALAQRLIADGRQFSYTGFDLSEPMVESARRVVSDPRCRFTHRASELAAADVTLASGLFNVKLDADEAAWKAYVLNTLDAMATLSLSGFAFNMLTSYSHPPRRSAKLFYADPGEYLRICKERYSRSVAILHDYDLFEFTVLVRLGADAVPLA
jgi:SAM-dependent methyltransferase